jgi:hypothetical protein
MANFQPAFERYQQHLDIDSLTPMPPDGSIPSGKDVSLFVGRNGEVLMYPRDPAPGGTGALRGIYGLDEPPNDVRSTGLHFFEDGTPQPIAVLPHLVTSNDPTGGIDVTLPSGAREHCGSIRPMASFDSRRTMPMLVAVMIRRRNGSDMCRAVLWMLRRMLRPATDVREIQPHRRTGSARRMLCSP